MAPRGWEVLNQSRGGDNTQSMMAPRSRPKARRIRRLAI